MKYVATATIDACRVMPPNECVAYRDPRLALEEKVRRLESDLLEANERLDAQRLHTEELERRLRHARKVPFVERLGQGTIYAAVGAVGGLLVAALGAVASGNLMMLVPGVLLGALFGGLYGLGEDIR